MIYGVTPRVLQKQRAHNTWFTKGDRNIGFFHAFASKRKRKNYVKKLRNEAGDVIVGDQLKSFIANQYNNCFSQVRVIILMRCWIVLMVESHKK